MGFTKKALVSSLLMLGQQAAALDPIVMKVREGAIAHASAVQTPLPPAWS